MANIGNIERSMKALEDMENEKYIKSTKIDVLKEKKQILIKELPVLEEELAFWQKDLSKLERSNSDEDLETWKTEITNIHLKIDKKKNEIVENKNYLNNEIKSEKDLNEKIKNLRSDIKNQIFHILREKNYINNYSKNDLLIITEILKKTLKTEYELQVNSFIDLILDEGIELHLSYLELINRVFNGNLIIIPEIITQFIADYLNDFKSGSLLDPWPLNGFMLKILSSEIRNKDLIALNLNENKIFQKFHNLNVNLDSNKNDLTYDFIVGCPPFEEINTFKNNLDMKIRDNYSFINFFNAALKIDVNGIGIFILNKDFLLNRKSETVFTNLNKYDIYIKSVIEIPYVLSGDHEKIIVIITRKPQKNIFIGSLSQDPAINKILKINLIHNQTGKIPQHGHITSLSSFYTFKSIYAHIESLKMSKNLDFPIKPFTDIIKEINLPSDTSSYPDQPNSIYIPLDESRKVEIDPEKINGSEFIQVVLDNQNSLAEYLAIYLNETFLGRKIRESINLGSFTESLFINIIANIAFFIPDLETQIEVLRVNSLINEIATRTDYNKDQLWQKPNEYPSIIREIESLDDNIEYHFEKWVESLPYPLASILWESFSTSKPDLKVKYLLHFFEAFSEFNVILLISGLISDERFFNLEFHQCIQYNPKFKNWFERPSFGNWNFFGKCLGKNIQYILRKQYKRNQLLEIFGNSEPDFLNKMSSYELYNILGEVNRYRNSWDAHGPVVSNEEYQNRFKILRNSISKLYSCLGNIFKNNLLVLPIGSTYKDGIHHYTVKRFMGSRNRFISIEIETTKPMDSDKIYLILENSRTPIELLPLIKFYKNYCYFYNSSIINENKSQFVSYHNKEEPEISCSLKDLELFYKVFESDRYYKKY